MEDVWWDGYEAGMTGEGTCPYPFGLKRVLWETGKAFGCHALATILESLLEPDPTSLQPAGPESRSR